MDTADGDIQGDYPRPEQPGLEARSNDVVSIQPAAQPDAFKRTMSVRPSLGSSLANAVQVQPVEIFLVFANGVMCSDLATELRRKSDAFLIRSFDTVESFLLYLMRHPMPQSSQRIAVSQLTFTGMSGVDGLAQIRKLEPSVKTILVGNDPGASTVIQAWRQGAADFLLQPLSMQEMTQSILSLIEHEQPSNRSMMRKGSHPEALKLMGSLTRRELEVFRLVVRGHLNKEMAQILHISLPTVKMHRANLMRKLGLANAAQLVSFYHENVAQIF